jgi:hypothetical protein
MTCLVTSIYEGTMNIQTIKSSSSPSFPSFVPSSITYFRPIVWIMFSISSQNCWLLDHWMLLCISFIKTNIVFIFFNRGTVGEAPTMWFNNVFVGTTNIQDFFPWGVEDIHNLISQRMKFFLSYIILKRNLIKWSTLSRFISSGIRVCRWCD